MDLTEFSFLILAGGKSSRMGENKAELAYNGKSFLETLIYKGKSSGFSEIIVSGYPQEICGITPIPDDLKERGPLGGLYSCFKAAKTQYCFVISVDVPKININSLLPMAQYHVESEKKVTMLSKNGKIEPLIGVYNSDLHQEIYEIIKDRSARVTRLLDNIEFNVYNFKGDFHTLDNINTKEDYKSLF